jgi:hypothetical protein
MVYSKVLTIAGGYCWTCGTEGEAAGSACAVWRINWMAGKWALQCSKTMAGRWNEMSERKLGYKARSVQEWLITCSWIGMYQKTVCREELSLGTEINIQFVLYRYMTLLCWYRGVHCKCWEIKFSVSIWSKRAVPTGNWRRRSRKLCEILLLLLGRTEQNHDKLNWR